MDHLIFSIGHSNRTRSQLIELLKRHGVRRLVDVRRRPRSGRHPWFSRKELQPALEQAGIAYVHEEDLGGYRKTPADSGPFEALDSSWWGYAAHMRSDRFREAVERLIHWSESGPLALMCAEKSPEHCHRQLLCDFLVLSGHPVQHIIGESTPENHRPHDAALLSGGRLDYPPLQKRLL